MVVPYGPRLLMRTVVPPEGDVSSLEGLRLDAWVHAAGEVSATTGTGKVCRHGPEEEAAQDGALVRCELEVGESTDALTLRYDPGRDAAGDDPPAVSVAVPLRARDSEHFLVARGSASFGCDPIDAGRGTSGFEAGRDCWGDGSGAFYYRGRLGGLQLVAGADLRVRDISGSAAAWRDGDSAFRYLLGHDRRRVFRDLDPETYFPTYGDGSKLVDERESGGRFFMRVQHGDDYLRWGGVRTGVEDVEVGRYVRSLYGFGGRYTAGGGDSDWSLTALAFAARPTRWLRATSSPSPAARSIFFRIGISSRARRG